MDNTPEIQLTRIFG